MDASSDPDRFKIELAHQLLGLPEGAKLRPLSEAKDDVLEVIDYPFVVRIPKFTEDEIPLSDYQSLAAHYVELQAFVNVRIPRYSLVVDRGLVPPMAEVGPVTYMFVERIQGQGLDVAVRDGGVSPAVVDDLLAGLAVNLLDASKTGRSYVEDICHLDQYVVDGTDQSCPEVWLVDLEPRYSSVGADSLWRMDLFFMEVAELGKSICNARRYLEELPQATACYADLLDRISVIDPEAGEEMRATMAEPGGDGSWHRSAWVHRKRWSSLRAR